MPKNIGKHPDYVWQKHGKCRLTAN